MLCKDYKRDKFSWIVLAALTVICCTLLLYYFSISRGKFSISEQNINRSFHSEKLSSEQCPDTRCVSKECVISASMILDNAKERINPCDDFYSFACGKFQEKFSKDDNFSTAFNSMQISLKIQLKDILDNLKGTPGSSTEKLKTIYNSCMNDNSSEIKSVQSALEFLGRIGIYDWPNLPPNFKFPYSLDEVLSLLVVYQECSFLSFVGRINDEEASNRQEIAVINPGSTLRLYEPEERVINATLEYLGVDQEYFISFWQDIRRMDDDLSQVVQEQQDLYETCHNDDNGTLKLHLNCSDELSRNLRFLCNITKLVIQKSKLENIYSKSHVYIPCHSATYVKGVLSYLLNATDRSIANYIAIDFLFRHIGDMSLFFRLTRLNYYYDSTSFRYQPAADKVDNCIGWMSNFMFYALGYEYVSQKLSSEIVDDVDNMLHQILHEASELVLQQTWIEEKMRNELKYEIGNTTNLMHTLVKVLRNETAVNDIYKDLFPTNESFLLNVLEFQRAFFTWEKSSAIVDMFQTPFIVNLLFGEGVDIKFGFLQQPAYQYGRNKFLNLAMIGFCLGHEVGHKISYFFGDSSYNETEAIFSDGKDCLVQQYSNFRIEKIGKNVLGNYTYFENIADALGMKIAERILHKQISETQGANKSFLPGLPYSLEQTFYIAIAQMWCEVRSKEKEKQHYERDGHSPGRFRITGVLQNSRDFSRVFNCPEGSYMNPARKCTLFE